MKAIYCSLILKFYKQEWFLVRLFPESQVKFLGLSFSLFLSSPSYTVSSIGGLCYSGLQEALRSPFITPKLAAIVSECSFSHRIVGERKGVSCPSTRIHPLESSLNDSVQSGSCDVSIGFHQTAAIHDKWVSSPEDIRRVWVRIRETAAWGTFKGYLHIRCNVSCTDKYSQEWIHGVFMHVSLLCSIPLNFRFPYGYCMATNTKHQLSCF